MTVKELIEELKKFDQDKKVIFDELFADYDAVSDIQRVTQDDENVIIYG